MSTLTTNGSFYSRFTGDSERYSVADKNVIEDTVNRLISVPTSIAKPGMLLGKIQSGKTKTFLAIMALAFDNGFDISVVFTKGTKALTRQTLERVRREYAQFNGADDKVQIFDIMTVPAILTPYELSQKLIFVVKKQPDNLDRLVQLFQEKYPQLASKRALLIDDEADQASVGFRRNRQEGIIINTTTQKLETLRQLLNGSTFLQVTATPYSLYLQQEDFVVNGKEFKPIRPAFTELVPIHPNYIGSDYYFEISLDNESIASFVYQPVTLSELQILHHQDRRRFKIEECLKSTAISSLRDAVCNFIIGGCIRRLQDKKAGMPPKKYSFLVHTEAGRAAHTWQEQIVVMLNEKLVDAARTQPDLLRELFTSSYNNLARSIRLLNNALPPLEQVLDESFTALKDGWLMITKVNSERQVDELLDNEGQLKLRTPLNIFIGGQILDRGITVGKRTRAPSGAVG